MPSPLDTACGPRGSGRTYRMIMALPDRAVVVVPSTQMDIYVRGEIDRHRGRPFNDTIQVVRIMNDVGVASLRLMRQPIFVDHSFWEQPSLTYALGRRLESLLEEQGRRGTANEMLDRMRVDAPPPPLPQSSYENMMTNIQRVRTSNPPRYDWEERAETPLAPRNVTPVRNTRGNRRTTAQTYDGPEAEDL